MQTAQLPCSEISILINNYSSVNSIIIFDGRKNILMSSILHRFINRIFMMDLLGVIEVFDVCVVICMMNIMSDCFPFVFL